MAKRSTAGVLYAAANRQHELQFPRDFAYLTQLTGGQSVARQIHRDNEVFERWKMSKKKAIERVNNAPTGPAAQNHILTDEQHVDVIVYLSQFAVNQQLDPAPAPSLTQAGFHGAQGSGYNGGIDLFEEYLKSLPSVPQIPTQSQSRGVSYAPAIAPAPVFQHQVTWLDHDPSSATQNVLQSGGLKQQDLFSN
ncbi:hypothetical protein N0V83_009189 [Neocucurbitaria cava]|uniref:Uncharacterized protein n=1 Tax=Neocucurbitaria cava TaxID=798079 RepID=A0A9W8Y0F1_9PLEO|nr:hypothetical protein N0V83_009189 [Neocucurbitaria cava]